MTTMKKIILTIMMLSCLAATDALSETQKSNESKKAIADSGALAGHRHRVVVSSDIGGTDPDDFQSMVHLLVYADVLDIEGLISSPFGPGQKEHILQVIDCYEKDYANLKTYSDKYPTPDALRAITKQGGSERAPYAGVRQLTEGSQWIIECARRDDPRPLHVLIWGGIEDLTQALHDAPDILPKLRVYWIGGPNKKWSPDAYQYIVNHRPELWIIESNATYRGWFVGGNQSGQWGNKEFVTQHIAGKGTLGDFFVSKKDDIKMGDTPSVGWLLNGNSDDPSQPGWGGSYVRAWERPYSRFDRMTTQEDRMEIFGILELMLPMTGDVPEQPEAILAVDNQKLTGHAPGDSTMRFRFCPKAAKRFSFKIQSNVPALDGKTGGIEAYTPSPDMAQHPAANLPNWWTDDPSPDAAEGSHHGAKTVSQWREDFLGDFAQRMLRCQSPKASADKNTSPTPAAEMKQPVTSVKLTEIQWHGVGCYRIEMSMGVVYFEKDNGVSGFKSFVDPEGNDWVASYLPPGPNGNFRGFPNSVGNFGHAGRDSGSTNIVVDGKTEGDHVILESTNGKFTFQYWFFPDHISIKVLKSQGDYHFLLEGVAGGTADAEDFFVTADGKKHIPTEEGEFDDFTPEWIYLGDPKSKHLLFFAKSPEDNAPNENHRQIRKGNRHNMDLYSFGRTGIDNDPKYHTYGMSDNEHVCVIGFAPAERTHQEMSTMIEGFLASPFAIESAGR